MVVSTVEAASEAGAPQAHRGGWQRVVLIALALAVLAASVTGITILRGAPNLGVGSFYLSNPTVIEANDGYQDTKHVVNGISGGTLFGSVSNNGSVSVTLLGLDIPHGTPSVLARISFEPDPFAPGKAGASYTPLVSQVTLKPGQEAGVVLQVRTPSCLPQEKGSSLSYDAIPVKVRRLGFERSASIPLDLPLWVTYTADHPSTGNCF